MKKTKISGSSTVSRTMLSATVVNITLALMSILVAVFMSCQNPVGENGGNGNGNGNQTQYKTYDDYSIKYMAARFTDADGQAITIVAGSDDEKKIIKALDKTLTEEQAKEIVEPISTRLNPKFATGKAVTRENIYKIQGDLTGQYASGWEWERKSTGISDDDKAAGYYLLFQEFTFNNTQAVEKNRPYGTFHYNQPEEWSKNYSYETYVDYRASHPKLKGDLIFDSQTNLEPHGVTKDNLRIEAVPGTTHKFIVKLQINGVDQKDLWSQRWSWTQKSSIHDILKYSPNSWDTGADTVEIIRPTSVSMTDMPTQVTLVAYNYAYDISIEKPVSVTW